MTTEINEFQWSDIISYTENTYDTYLKLENRDRDKYMKFEIKAEIDSDQHKEYTKFTGKDINTAARELLLSDKQLTIASLLLKQMKYHCGKPLKLSLSEKGPAKHIPIIDYFERNKSYLKDYDYIIIDRNQYETLIEENFLLFQSHAPPLKPIHNQQALKNVGKIGNLDVFATWDYPDKDLRMDEFDVIIGRRDWVDLDLITAYEGKTYNDIEPGKEILRFKYLLKMSFPVKRGFMRLKAEMKV